MDTVLVSTSMQNIPQFRDYAEKYGMGLELQAFADPVTLSNGWRTTLEWHKRELSRFNGYIGVHGAFYDLTSASLDPAILSITRQRYRQNLQVASELEAGYVLFHLNYMGMCRIPNYQPGWHQRQVEFWSEFAAEAARMGVPVLIENSWEDDPSLIANILSEVDSPYLRACLDVAHATLYSEYSVEAWIEALEPYLHCSHLNNHDGRFDVHWPLGRGVIEYAAVLSELRALARPPLFCLEMTRWSFIENSLPFLEMAPVPG